MEPTKFDPVMIRLQYQGLKEIDSIWAILKESKSWGEKKEERKLDTSRKRYVRAANTNTLVKQTHDLAPDLRSSSWNHDNS